MKTKKLFLFKVFTLFCVSLFLLSSCEETAQSPEDVIENFKDQVTEIKSGDISAEVVMNGTDNEDIIDFTADINFKFDRNDLEDKKADINISLSGMMKTAEQALDGDIDLNIRTIADDYYILLDKLESSSESMQALEPVLQGYIGKWLHIADDFIPENIRQLQQKDEETLAKEEQLKQLFIDTELFVVTKEYGTETINGNKVHHYGVQFSEDGIQEYIRKAAVIDGRELTDAEIAEASKIVSYMTSAELWIGAKDYYLYKATAYFTGGMTDENVDMGITVTLIGSDYNSPIKISAPSDSQEFNPLELLMAYSAANMDLGDMPEPEAE